MSTNLGSGYIEVELDRTKFDAQWNALKSELASQPAIPIPITGTSPTVTPSAPSTPSAPATPSTGITLPKSLLGGMTGAGSGIDKITGKVKNAGRAFGALGETATKAMRSMQIPGGEKISALISLIGRNLPLAIAAGAVAVAVGIYKMIKDFDSISKQTDRIGEGFRSMFDTVGEIMINAFGLDSVFEFIADSVENLVDFIVTFKKQIAAVLTYMSPLALLIKMMSGKKNPYEAQVKSTKEILKNLRMMSMEDVWSKVQDMASMDKKKETKRGNTINESAGTSLWNDIKELFSFKGTPLSRAKGEAKKVGAIDPTSGLLGEDEINKFINKAGTVNKTNIQNDVKENNKPIVIAQESIDYISQKLAEKINKSPKQKDTLLA